MERLKAFLGVGSELHRQNYRMPRDYPQAYAHLAFTMFCLGFAVATLIARLHHA